MEHYVSRSGLHESAVIDEKYLVGQFEAFFEIVRHEYDGQLQALTRCSQYVIKTLPEAGVEAAGGLIEEENARVTGKNSSEGSAPFLAARELCGFASGEVGELKGVEKFVDTAATIQSPASIQSGSGKTQIIAYRHVGKQSVVLKDVATTAALRREMNTSRYIDV